MECNKDKIIEVKIEKGSTENLDKALEKHEEQAEYIGRSREEHIRGRET